MNNKNISITGLALVILGAIFLLNNFMEMDFLKQYLNWDYIWPLILIVWGVKMIMKRL